jgi:transcriptional regulator with XRE-family HTH domain
MRLKKWLLDNGMDVRTFSKKIGCSEQTAYHWVNGHNFPTLKFMQRIATLTKGAVTPNDLVGLS